MASSPTALKTKRIAAATIAAGAIAAGFEGISYVPYSDPRPHHSILTVCYGHTGNIQNRVYTLDECKQLLADDMKTAVQIVEKCHPDIPMNVLIAFSDATYNIGPKVACNSTASTYLSEKKYTQACDELLKWNKSNGQVLPGLTKRRQEEAKVCKES